MTIHSLHAALLPLLTEQSGRLSDRDRASARASADCWPAQEDQCAAELGVRPESPRETTALCISLSAWEPSLELLVTIDDVNNFAHGRTDILQLVDREVVPDVAAALAIICADLDVWVDALLALLDRERVYEALPFAPDPPFRSACVNWLREPQHELGGRTPAQAIASGGLDVVTRIAATVQDPAGPDPRIRSSARPSR
jgi:hypothetical protein